MFWVPPPPLQQQPCKQLLLYENKQFFIWIIFIFENYFSFHVMPHTRASFAHHHYSYILEQCTQCTVDPASPKACSLAFSIFASLRLMLEWRGGIEEG